MTDKANDMPTPIDKLINIDFLEIEPWLISSTCLFKVCIAGSAKTTKIPIINPKGIYNHFVFPIAKVSPILDPIGINPIFTAVKNNVNPKYVYKIPMKIFNNLFLFKRCVKY